MDYQTAITELEALDRQIVLLEHIASTLSYDQEVALSAMGVEERSQQLGYLAEQKHALECGQRVQELLDFLGQLEAQSEFDQGLIRIRKRELDKNRNLSSDLVRSLSEQASRSHVSWVEARKQGDWTLFSKDFSGMVGLVKQKARMLAEDEHALYDVLLDEFEMGMPSSTVTSLFATIKQPLIDLVDSLVDKRVDAPFLYEHYPIDRQQQFARRVLKDMGFDFERGSFAVSVHPFTSTVGCDDVRITTRYTDPSVGDSFSSSIHEGGHGLYELGASSGRLKGTSLANGASYGMHESQSRLWENMIAKSPEFWEHYYPYFCELFPDQTKGVGVERFVKALNNVGRTPIRVNADEVSYSLHIMLRFSIEQMIINDEITIDEVPSAWNELSYSLLGFRPKNNREGVLQDVHWSGGDFGYFPTYALGNLYGAQIYQSLKQQLPVAKLLQKGDLRTITGYLDQTIYKRGAMYTGLETLKLVTNKSLDATLFTSYLDDKYSRLFG